MDFTLKANVELERLSLRKSRMLDYLHLKVSEQDWHGVADAAMDLREIEQSIEVWEEIHHGKI